MTEQRSRTRRAETGPLAPVRETFDALLEAFVPEAVDLDRASRERSFHIVQEALRSRPRVVQRQVVWLVRALDALSLVRHGRRLAKLTPDCRYRVLEPLQRSRLPLLRRGIWGLRSLAFMGYYARPEVHAALGYRASPEGWEAVR